MRQYLIHYSIVLAIFLAIDFAWLSTAGRTIYVSEIGSLLRDRPNLAVAFLFYALFALGLLVFVIEPAVPAGLSKQVLILGGFFGLVAYATYDLTNLATLKGFTTRIAIIDMVWGTALSAGVTALSLAAIKLLKV
jgi:uncharacterized membrane protein